MGPPENKASTWSKGAAAVALLLLAHQVAAAPLKPPSPYVHRMGQQKWLEYPGGKYKASTTSDLPTTTIAGAVFQLNAGALRELHWHDATEWAVVLNGTCRATMLDDSLKAPVDTWDFGPGDVWYFPANTAHTVLGLGPDGCTYMTGWDKGAFDERDSFGASSWAAATPTPILATALGISEAEAATLKASTPAAGTFLSQGSPKVMEALQPAPVRPQWPKLIHKFPLSHNTYSLSGADGSYINKADVDVFPVSTNMAGAIMHLAPGATRQMHWHFNIDEWQFVVNGTVEAGVFIKPGVHYEDTLGPGDVGFAPRGSGHYVRNPTDKPATLVLVFNDGKFTDTELPNFLGTVPAAWTAASLNTTTQVVNSFDYKRTGFALPLQAPPTKPARPARKIGAVPLPATRG